VSTSDLQYTKTHEWVRLASDPTGQKIATMGLTAFALEALTDLVFIDLPEAGREVKQGETLGEVESVKAVSDLYSPVDGRVVEVHSEITADLKRLAEDPYGEGWLVKIAVAGAAGFDQLLDEAAYKKQCEQEAADH